MWRLHEEDKKLTNQGMESHYSETLPKVSKRTRNTCVACGILFKLGKLWMKYQGNAKTSRRDCCSGMVIICFLYY